MSNVPLKIIIVEPSSIIRSGLEVILKKIPGFRVSGTEVKSADLLEETIRMQQPDILVINPVVPGYFSLQQIKEHTDCVGMKCVALLCTPSNQTLLHLYDEQICIYDTPEEIRQKLERFRSEETEKEENGEEQQMLSSREKEIVICVVKGMTNREIADKLFLSTHTVITHRRNIARKLQIHSASGLTIYAIVNKLVELNEIKM